MRSPCASGMAHASTGCPSPNLLPCWPIGTNPALPSCKTKLSIAKASGKFLRRLLRCIFCYGFPPVRERHIPLFFRAFRVLSPVSCHACMLSAGIHENESEKAQFRLYAGPPRAAIGLRYDPSTASICSKDSHTKKIGLKAYTVLGMRAINSTWKGARITSPPR